MEDKSGKQKHSEIDCLFGCFFIPLIFFVLFWGFPIRLYREERDLGLFLFFET